MRHKFRFALVAATTLIFLLPCIAQEEKLEKSDLPAAVQKTADRESNGATIRGYSTEVDNGRREYEMETMVNGHSRDVSIAADGTVLEIEEQVEMKDLPQDVQRTLRAKAGHGTITKIESLTKHGKLVAYEAQLRSKGNYYEIQVGPNGKSLAHPE